ncbi:DUF4307 domain-containing protein [Nocardiopsis suaedae]|uniref:DUF4307 domain-containing protein n=1 Tax=Nocardiopsis suaedae TaxID=3018444 RepID=A0ABT4TEP0_9ACTN|nr:DUF4307 domain-containing protein [Nocardiopsis suaedae]MDA2803144.1 DUF4307 domain-containing protein [Nocardiopsis suaedae]
MPESPSDLTPDGAERHGAAGGDGGDNGGSGPRAAGSAVGKRHGARPVFFVLGLIAAAVFTVGWGFALMSYGDHTGVANQTIAWSIESDDAASITFQTNSGGPAVCVVRATDSQHVEVGQRRVEVGAGTQDVTTEIETVRRAAMVEVASCRDQGTAK